MKHRVVVTGMGAITPIGNEVDTFWENTMKGENGVGKLTAFDTKDFKVKVAGQVKDFDPKKHLDRKKARRMDRFSQFAVVASKEAVVHANLDLESIDHERFGVVIGSGMGALGMIEKEIGKLHEKGPKRVAPLFIPMVITNMAAGNVAIEFGAKGVCTNIVTACATGTHCIGEAFKMLQFGRADVILAGGTEATISPMGIAGFQALTAVTENQDPSTASRPFDKNRDGFVMGEGAGVLCLETLEHAKQRNANILAEIVGYGATCDAFHITAPPEDGDGGARAMILAMEDAGIEPEDVSYINAHGTSTPTNGRTETAAIKKAFKEEAYNIPVSSSKSMIGHLLGAAGGVEAVVCVKALQEGFIPATINYQTKDPDCDLDFVPTIGRKKQLNYALSNSLGFGGHNGSLIFKRW